MGAEDLRVPRCANCGAEKTPENCSFNAKYRDGYMSWCKACTTESGRRSRARLTEEQWEERLARRREQRARNRDAINARKRAERQADPKRYREQERRRYQQNPEAGRARQRRYRDRNLEAVRRRYQRWETENREHRLLLNSRRRARLANAFAEDVDRHVVLERDDGMCGICGEDVNPFDFQVDHIVPLVHGGLHNYENSQVAHRLCNQRKNVHLVEEVA